LRVLMTRGQKIIVNYLGWNWSVSGRRKTLLTVQDALSTLVLTKGKYFQSAQANP
jgi:hypothetical protein